MKAILYEQYGPPDVLHAAELTKPVPKDNEMLIRVYATTVTSGDVRVRSLNVPTGFRLLTRLALGITKPRQPILGMELAGKVEAVGKKVSQFQKGDAVFAFSDTAMGCYVEYKCMSETSSVVRVPANLSVEAAAALSFGGTTALHFLRMAALQPGESVLINGASGSVGTAAIQLAKYFGAKVSAVCSCANTELVRALGADQVIDYTQEDFTHNGKTYDVIMDIAGTAAYPRCKKSLKPGGRLLLILAGLPDMLLAPWHSMTSQHTVKAGMATGRAEDLRFLAELAEQGHYRPVIDRCYRFDQIVEAHRYVDTGHKKGNVVITLA